MAAGNLLLLLHMKATLELRIAESSLHIAPLPIYILNFKEVPAIAYNVQGLASVAVFRDSSARNVDDKYKIVVFY